MQDSFKHLSLGRECARNGLTEAEGQQFPQSGIPCRVPGVPLGNDSVTVRDQAVPRENYVSVQNEALQPGLMR